MTQSRLLTMTTLMLAVTTLAGCTQKDSGGTPADTSGTASANPAGVRGPTKVWTRKDKGGKPTIVTTENAGTIYVINRTSPPNTRTLLATYRNLGWNGAKMQKESIYGFAPDAEYRIYALDKRDPLTKTTAWEIMEVADGSTTEVRFSGGGFVICEAPHSPGPPDAGFKMCDKQKPVSANQSGMFDTRFMPTLVTRALSLFAQQSDSAGGRPSGDTDPAWVSCSDGCCTLAGARAN